MRSHKNDIIIYWSGAPSMQPADRAVCWTYEERLRNWDTCY